MYVKSASSIEAKFSRLNTPGNFTKLFKEMNEKEKRRIKEEVTFLENEIPVLFFSNNASYWWVLTTMRLVIHEDKTMVITPLQQIKLISLDDTFNQKTKKQDIDEIVLLLSESTKLRLKIEHNTWHIIYSVLRFAIS